MKFTGLYEVRILPRDGRYWAIARLAADKAIFLRSLGARVSCAHCAFKTHHTPSLGLQTCNSNLRLPGLAPIYIPTSHCQERKWPGIDRD